MDNFTRQRPTEDHNTTTPTSGYGFLCRETAPFDGPLTPDHCGPGYKNFLLATFLAVNILLIPQTLLAEAIDKNEGTISNTLSLTDYLKCAGGGTFDLLLAQEKLRAAEMDLRDSKTLYWPKIAAAVDYVYKDSYNTGEPGPVRPYIAFKQNTFNDFDNIQRVKNAISSLYSAKLSFEKAKLATLTLAGEKYFNLLLAQKMVDWQGQKIDEKKRDVAGAERKFGLGLLPEIELLRIRASLSRTTIELASRKGTLGKAQYELGTVINLPPNNLPMAVEGTESVSIQDKYTSKDLAINNSFELRINNEALIRMRSLSEAVKWTRWPQLGAQAYIGYNPDDVDNQADYAIIFTLSKNLFDGGSTSRRIETARIEVRSWELLVNQAKKSIENKIDTLFSELEFKESAIAEILAQRKSARKFVDLSRKGYELGLTSFKELLDAQALADEQENAITVALINKHIIEFKINMLTGYYNDLDLQNCRDDSAEPAHTERADDHSMGQEDR